MVSADRWLLPEGIDEILPPHADQLEQMRRDLLDLYRAWGYQQVFPPLVEYVESLLIGSGNDLALQTFRLTDQLTGRQMGIRADMTPQVARIDAHTLNRDGPARLCYVGHVLHTRPQSLGEPRSLVQLGAELYGCADIQADGEVAALLLTTLDVAGCCQVHLDLGHVGIYRALAAKAGLSEADEYELFDIYQRKAVPELQAFIASRVHDAGLADRFLALVELAGDRKVLDKAAEVLSGVDPAIQQALDELIWLADYLAAAFPQVAFYFDLGELRGYHYHTGPVFSAYVPGVGQAIATGGRYDKIGQCFGRERPATGFSTDLARLVRQFNRPPKDNGDTIFAPFVPEDNRLQLHIHQLRKAGHRVIVALPGSPVVLQQQPCNKALQLAQGEWQVVDLPSA